MTKRTPACIYLNPLSGFNLVGPMMQTDSPFASQTKKNRRFEKKKNKTKRLEAHGCRVEQESPFVKMFVSLKRSSLLCRIPVCRKRCHLMFQLFREDNQERNNGVFFFFLVVESNFNKAPTNEQTRLKLQKWNVKMFSSSTGPSYNAVIFLPFIFPIGRRRKLFRIRSCPDIARLFSPSERTMAKQKSRWTSNGSSGPSIDWRYIHTRISPTQPRRFDGQVDNRSRWRAMTKSRMTITAARELYRSFKSPTAFRYSDNAMPTTSLFNTKLQREFLTFYDTTSTNVWKSLKNKHGENQILYTVGIFLFPSACVTSKNFDWSLAMAARFPFRFFISPSCLACETTEWTHTGLDSQSRLNSSALAFFSPEQSLWFLFFFNSSSSLESTNVNIWFSLSLYLSLSIIVASTSRRMKSRNASIQMESQRDIWNHER